MESDIVTTPEAAPAATLSVLGSSGTREFIRYIAASALALAIDVATLSILTSWFAVPYLLSGAIAFTLGLVTVYTLSIWWVFDHRTARNWSTEFILFAVIGLIGLLINEVFLYVFTTALGLHYLLSKAASVIAVFTWNFCARKFLLFR